jgi:hypothetical protein
MFSLKRERKKHPNTEEEFYRIWFGHRQAAPYIIGAEILF